MGRILLVDDRADFRQVLGERMQARGYETLEAASGAQALELAAAQAPDLVVLDMVMPEMDGMETLRRLRQEHPGLPVIVLTGYGASQDVSQALTLGAHDYLVKPVDLDALLEAVQQALAGRQA